LRHPNFRKTTYAPCEFANTASVGSIIAFQRHHDDIKAGDVVVICSFGAGYSIGSVVLRRT